MSLVEQFKLVGSEQGRAAEYNKWVVENVNLLPSWKASFFCTDTVCDVTLQQGNSSELKVNLRYVS